MNSALAGLLYLLAFILAFVFCTGGVFLTSLLWSRIQLKKGWGEVIGISILGAILYAILIGILDRYIIRILRAIPDQYYHINKNNAVLYESLYREFSSIFVIGPYILSVILLIRFKAYWWGSFKK